MLSTLKIVPYHKMPSPTLDGSSTHEPSSWSATAEAYLAAEAKLVGPLCQEFAIELNAALSLSDSAAYALDNGCRPGAMAAALKTLAPNLPILCSNVAAGMIDKVRGRAEAARWETFQAQVMDGKDLKGIGPDNFSHVVSTFMVCLVLEPDRIMAEMFRVLKPGGVLGLGVWGEPRAAYWNDPFCEAARRLEPSYQGIDILKKEWTERAEIEKRTTEAGFRDVRFWEVTKPAG